MRKPAIPAQARTCPVTTPAWSTTRKALGIHDEEGLLSQAYKCDLAPGLRALLENRLENGNRMISSLPNLKLYEYDQQKGRRKMNIEELKTMRFQFLKALYEFSGGDKFKWLSMWDLGASLGFDRQNTKLTAEYLKSENLLKYQALGGIIGITHHGIKEVEDAISEPSKPTHYFPAVSSIHVNTMINSTIQQASPGATQIIQTGDVRIEQLAEIMTKLKESVDKLGLSECDRGDLQAEIDTIDAQLNSSKPKASIVSECLSSARSIIEGVSANVLASPLISLITAFLGS